MKKSYLNKSVINDVSIVKNPDVVGFNTNKKIYHILISIISLKIKINYYFPTCSFLQLHLLFKYIWSKWSNH